MSIYQYKILGFSVLSLVILFGVYLTLTSDSLLEHKGTPINFYKKDGLMWLIDTTRNNKRYDSETIEKMHTYGPEFIDRSYETYLNYVNSNLKYRYNDWRVPTEKELMQLEYKGGFLKRLFTSSEHIDHDISIDKDVFYDHEINHVRIYRTFTPCIRKDGDNGFIIVDFNTIRFDQFGFGRGGVRGGDGASPRCGSPTGIGNFRFVRDADGYVNKLLREYKGN